MFECKMIFKKWIFWVNNCLFCQLFTSRFKPLTKAVGVSWFTETDRITFLKRLTNHPILKEHSLFIPLLNIQARRTPRRMSSVYSEFGLGAKRMKPVRTYRALRTCIKIKNLSPRSNGKVENFPFQVRITT